MECTDATLRLRMQEACSTGDINYTTQEEPHLEAPKHLIGQLLKVPQTLTKIRYTGADGCEVLFSYRRTQAHYQASHAPGI